MNLLERYALLANPLTTIASSAYKDAVKAAPSSPALRLSNNPKVNLALWNAAGVASWALPLAAVATLLVNAKAKKEVDKARKKSDNQLLDASRPSITPKKLEKSDEEENANDKRLKLIENDNLALAKKANMSLFRDPLLATLPLVTVPASYWLANKLTSKFLSDKLEDDLVSERKRLRALQDAEDLERLRLLGLINEDAEEKKTVPLKKEASGNLFNSLSGAVQRMKDSMHGVDLAGLGKALLWDAHLAPIFAASALLAIGGGVYMSGRDKSTKKVKLLTKKLLGENRMHDPASLSIELPKGVSQGADTKQLQRIEGIQSAENNSKKDELFN